MNAFTLRLETPLAKKLDKICRKKGFTKTGLVKRLVEDFVEGETAKQKFMAYNNPGIKALEGLVGFVSLGGDAVKDSEDIYE